MPVTRDHLMQTFPDPWNTLWGVFVNDLFVDSNDNGQQLDVFQMFHFILVINVLQIVFRKNNTKTIHSWKADKKNKIKIVGCFLYG